MAIFGIKNNWNKGKAMTTKEIRKWLHDITSSCECPMDLQMQCPKCFIRMKAGTGINNYRCAFIYIRNEVEGDSIEGDAEALKALRMYWKENEL
jgi:hypothetical protein